MNFFKGLMLGIVISTLFIIVYINTANSTSEPGGSKFSTDDILLAGSRIMAGDPDKNEFFILGVDEPDPFLGLTKKQAAELNTKMTFVITEMIFRLKAKMAEKFSDEQICLITFMKPSQSNKPKPKMNLPLKHVSAELHRLSKSKGKASKFIKVGAANIYKNRLLKLITAEHEKMRYADHRKGKVIVLNKAGSKKLVLKKGSGKYRV